MEKIYFKTSHISIGGKIALIGIVLCFISLFMPWLSPFDGVNPLGIKLISSFSPLLGKVGLFILIPLCIMAFSICSIEKKEKLHFFSHIYFSDFISSLWGSIFIFLLSLHSFFLIGGLQFFSMNIFYGKGLILCITGSIIIFIGSIIMKNEYRKNIKGSYISELHSNQKMQDIKEEKNNMKLPF